MKNNSKCTKRLETLIKDATIRGDKKERARLESLLLDLIVGQEFKKNPHNSYSYSYRRN